MTPGTPLPWRLNGLRIVADVPKAFAPGAKVVTVANVSVAWKTSAQADADALFLVRAANAHDALVAELRKLEWSFAGACPVCGERLPSRGHRDHRDGCTLAAALALAAGSPGAGG